MVYPFRVFEEIACKVLQCVKRICYVFRLTNVDKNFLRADAADIDFCFGGQLARKLSTNRVVVLKLPVRIRSFILALHIFYFRF